MSHNSRLARLLDMLTYCRPAGSSADNAFREAFIKPTPGAYVDRFDNYHVTIGDAPRVLFSCHTDTVHRQSGRQTVHYDPTTGVITLSKRSRKHSNCLGADDTAGCFVMLELIAAGIPGRYVFHYGEECGADGSRSLALHHESWLQETPIAIAFDRRGRHDVITHQSAGRCCSDAFAQSLANQLTDRGLPYAPSDHGIFTDTANYTDAIGECTNLSVGYADEHRSSESLSVPHVFALIDALLTVDYGALVVQRKPGEWDDDDLWLRQWRERRKTGAIDRTDSSSIILDWRTGERLARDPYTLDDGGCWTDGDAVYCDECGEAIDESDTCACDDDDDRSLYLNPDYADLVREFRRRDA